MKGIQHMQNLTRRKFVITGTSAGLALAAMKNPVAAFAQGDKPTITVGSKDFTESIILGEIISLLLEENGYTVERQMNLGGTAVVHEGMVSGEVDTYVEYTGTGLLAILGQELPEPATQAEASPAAGATPAGSSPYADQVYDIVASEYPEQFGLEWLKPLGFNNTYALAMRSEQVEELGISTISDLVEHAGDLTFGAPQETMVREDGLPGLEKSYGLSFGDAIGLDPGLMYSAVANGDVDVITAFSTDGRIQAMDLTILEDDKNFYPPYYAAPVVRQELLEQAPEVEDIINQLAGTLDDEKMTSLNFEADENATETADVARNFLVEAGLIEG
jgi:glycine betaine/choline ABC-type transport system substrate-binding protein